LKAKREQKKILPNTIIEEEKKTVKTERKQMENYLLEHKKVKYEV
jgi:hypothetical protein